MNLGQLNGSINKMTFLILFALLTLSALFAGIETAMLSLSRGKIRSLVEQKKKGAKALYLIRQNPHRLLITLLICNCLANTAAASIATEAALKVFGDSGVGIATGIVTLLILTYGEITPKSFALQNAEAISLLFARFIQVLEVIFTPVVTIFELLTKLVNKITGEKPNILTEAELRSVISIGKEEGLLDKEATKRLQSVLDFEGTTVRKIMTPKADVISFDAGLTVEQFLAMDLDSPFDRYPLYDKNTDNVVGVLDIIDVIRATKDEKFKLKLKQIMRPTFFVKQEERLDTVLPQFKPKKSAMGIVINDKKEMVGVFTSQDIVEEIVGDIFEEEVI